MEIVISAALFVLKQSTEHWTLNISYRIKILLCHLSGSINSNPFEASVRKCVSIIRSSYSVSSTKKKFLAVQIHYGNCTQTVSTLSGFPFIRIVDAQSDISIQICALDIEYWVNWWYPTHKLVLILFTLGAQLNIMNFCIFSFPFQNK